MANRITLRGDDADYFEEFKDQVAQARGGSEPSNAEVVRLMMQSLDVEQVRRDPFERR